MASNHIVLLEPYFANAGKRLVKSPKLYLADSGMCCYLLGLTTDSFRTSPYVGAMWETFVFAEIRKALVASRSPLTTWFYRNDRQVEVDFLLLAGGSAKAIEVKWSELPSPADAKQLRTLGQWAADKGALDMATFAGLIVSRAAEPFPLRGEGATVTATNLPRFIETLMR